MFDAHNHLQRFPEAPAVIDRMRAAGISGCVVNGTREDDWDCVATLARNFPGFVHPAFGLHPWHAHQRSDDWLAHLERHLDSSSGSSIGECGLDGWVKGPSLEIQREVFLPQLAMARERDLPITIHALKAWEPLLEALKLEPPPERGFLLHSFGGSAELAKRFADLGAWFSFSGYFLHSRKAKVLEAYQSVPRERLMIETDAPDMLPPDEFTLEILPEQVNHPVNLVKIAAGLAETLGMPVKELETLTDMNARRFYGVATMPDITPTRVSVSPRQPSS